MNLASDVLETLILMSFIFFSFFFWWLVTIIIGERASWSLSPKCNSKQNAYFFIYFVLLFCQEQERLKIQHINMFSQLIQIVQPFCRNRFSMVFGDYLLMNFFISADNQADCCNCLSMYFGHSSLTSFFLQIIMLGDHLFHTLQRR